jgi:hypothetical protein
VPPAARLAVKLDYFVEVRMPDEETRQRRPRNPGDMSIGPTLSKTSQNRQALHDIPQGAGLDEAHAGRV